MHHLGRTWLKQRRKLELRAAQIMKGESGVDVIEGTQKDASYTSDSKGGKDHYKLT